MPRGRVVRIDGILHGFGYQGRCELVARRISDEEAAGKCPYTNCIVISSPSVLADGEYTVVFSGYHAIARRQHGNWVSMGVPHRLKDSEGNDYEARWKL